MATTATRTRKSRTATVARTGSFFKAAGSPAFFAPAKRPAPLIAGPEKAGVVFGWVFAAHMVGAGVAASYAGLVRQGTGDYFGAWMTAGVLCLLAAFAVLAIPATREPAVEPGCRGEQRRGGVCASAGGPALRTAVRGPRAREASCGAGS